MSKHWKDVKAAIEKDIDRIWFEEPEEVKMSRLGIFPSGAGSHDQVLGNLFFQACDTQAMGWWTVGPAISAALSDDTFSVEHCQAHVEVSKRSHGSSDGCQAGAELPRSLAEPAQALGVLPRYR